METKPQCTEKSKGFDGYIIITEESSKNKLGKEA